MTTSATLITQRATPCNMPWGWRRTSSTSRAAATTLTLLLAWDSQASFERFVRTWVDLWMLNGMGLSRDDFSAPIQTVIARKNSRSAWASAPREMTVPHSRQRHRDARRAKTRDEGRLERPRRIPASISLAFFALSASLCRWREALLIYPASLRHDCRV
ncbi:MAG: hypothetical protein Q8L71_10165 [Thiobacillus sp.]|nr:hypothetical protein [Thiobacillus sp.]